MARKKRENNTELTRTAIRNEAVKLINSGGTASLSISRVAETLNMTHSNIYRHFPSKSALAAEIAAIWMKEMRDACENSIAHKRSTRSQLLALVLTIREQLMLRAEVPDAMSIYRYVLAHKPEEALIHHIHRRDLIVGILVSAGWPQTKKTELHALTILDALRFFTDPPTVAANIGGDMQGRIERLVTLLSEHIVMKGSSTEC